MEVDHALLEEYEAYIINKKKPKKRVTVKAKVKFDKQQQDLDLSSEEEGTQHD